MGIYFVTQIHEIIKSSLIALSLLKNSGFSFYDMIYLKGIVTDFIKFDDKNVPFLITVKLKND